MAGIIEADHFNNISDTHKDAVALRTKVQSLDKKIKDLKMLESTKESSDHRKNLDPAATIEALQSSQEGLRARVDELLSKFSVIRYSTDDDDEALRRFKREERSLSFRVNRLAKTFKKPNSRNNLEGQGGQKSTWRRQKGNLQGKVESGSSKDSNRRRYGFDDDYVSGSYGCEDHRNVAPN